ncbi:MAG TPA: magnesium transporter [Acidimicrobiales bacterium]|nr:magnesium transporter [Acidimicrobiales bacterium]
MPAERRAQRPPPPRRASAGRAWLVRRARALLGGAAAARHSLVALGFNSTTSIVAGVVLGSIIGIFDRLPGLLIMVPAAIGLRGNISTAFGNRLSTSIHTGQFRLSRRRRSLLMQNLEASFILSAALSVGLAVVAKLGAIAFGVEGAVPVHSLALISITAGLLSSLVVHTVTVVLAWATVRFGWDLDNVIAPVDSTFGDVLTLPSLWLTSHLVGMPGEALLAWLLIAASLAVFAYGLFGPGEIVRDVTRQSWPILLAAVCVQTLAGVILEQRLDALVVLPALLVLQPAFVSSAGALGGILSSRLASRLHLGVVQPTAVPGRGPRRDALVLVGLAVAVYLFDGAAAHGAARLTGLHSPGLLPMTALSLVAGLISVAFVLVIAYYGTILAYRFRLDPDIYGIPAVTSSVDFAGSLVLISLAAGFVLPG